LFPSLIEKLRCPVCPEEAPLVIHDVFVQNVKEEILEGMLLCKTCGRWFRISEGVADLVRDELREVMEDKAFLSECQDILDEDFLSHAFPTSLNKSSLSPNEEDQRILEEGRHWGQFMKEFWDVGDRSIFDLSIKGTHPSFYIKGVLEPDDRDFGRTWSFFPHSTGELLFSKMKDHAGKWAADIGCGGGQFGLEAARQGLHVIGFDPSFQEVSLGRRHAREQGIDQIEYIRAEPGNPPFRKESFDLLLAKDSLHHIPGLKNVFPRLLETLKEDGFFICHEHVEPAQIKNRFFSLVAPFLTEKIRRRYPLVEVPQAFLRDSANEDVSCEEICPLLEQYFTPLGTREDIFLALELEMFIHYAYGKRSWLTLLAFQTGRLLEFLFLLLGDRQHYSFVGQRRKEP
jgi:SAM-dependent methyltransferase/uncharacterized protein YbaR (Trm112 family)